MPIELLFYFQQLYQEVLMALITVIPCCACAVNSDLIYYSFQTGTPILVTPIVSGSESTPASLRAFDLDRLNAIIDFTIIGSM